MNAQVAIRTCMFLSLVMLTSGTLVATDGVVLINQARALAGGVTPGDTPGFPVTISLSGSYRLSGNLTVPDANTKGIEVKEKDVSIDLNGFVISGPTRCSGQPTRCDPPVGVGIGIESTADNTSVSNGTVRGMGWIGIVRCSFVSNIRAMDNGQIGISLSSGIATGNYAVRNGSSGIHLNYEGTITGNFVADNGGRGIGGFQDKGLISGNMITNNAREGISVSPRTSYYGNTLAGNNDEGAQVSGGANLGTNLCGNALCP